MPNEVTYTEVKKEIEEFLKILEPIRKEHDLFEKDMHNLLVKHGLQRKSNKYGVRMIPQKDIYNKNYKIKIENRKSARDKLFRVLDTQYNYKVLKNKCEYVIIQLIRD